MAIFVEAKPKANGDLHEVHFSIKDAGIGISEENISRLFQPFSQEDTSIARKYGGTGLGLAISKRLVEMTDGKTWIETSWALDQTFTLIFLHRPAPFQR